MPCYYSNGSLAQRLEQDAHNVLVVGSIPTRPTIIKNQIDFERYLNYAKDENKEYL